MHFESSYFIFGLLFLLLCGLFLWYYLCIIMPFSKMPSVRMDLCIIQMLLARKKLTISFFEKMTSVGKEYFSEGFFVLWILKPIVIIFNEEYIKNVMKNNINKAAEYKIFHDVLKNGIFSADKCLWRQRRKMFTPLYRAGKVKDKMGIFNKHSRKTVEDLSEMDLTAPVEITKLLNSFSFKVMSEAVLGIDNESSYASDMDCLFELIDKASEFLVHRITKPWLYFMKLFPEGRTFLRRLKKGNEFAEKVLMELKESFVSQLDNESKTSSQSFADVLVEHHIQNPDYPIEGILTDIKSFIIAGYDTVSIGLLWCLYLLGQHADIQNRVYEEVKSMEGDLSFEDLQKLAYTECVIKESLRLYPPAPIFGRSLEKDMQLGKYKIPKGTSVIIDVFTYHRNPNVYSNPDKFDPDRFLASNPEENQWTYLSFSAGTRNCIGYKFAIMEMKVVLAHILRRFKIIANGDYRSTQVRWEMMLKPDEPIFFTLIPRH